MCRCAAITTVGSVVRRAALWQSEGKNGKNMAGAVPARSEDATDDFRRSVIAWAIRKRANNSICNAAVISERVYPTMRHQYNNNPDLESL
jgi:hypothetical protein